MIIGLTTLFLPLAAGFIPLAARNPVLSLHKTSFEFDNKKRPIQTIRKIVPKSRWEDDIEEKVRRKTQGVGGGAGEVAAGAILGGLVMGPFGALFGAQLGAQIGARRAADIARQQEMERLGVTQDMIDTAQELGLALEQAVEGLQASRASLETQQQFARQLEKSVADSYEKAKREIAAGREVEARSLLLEKNRLQEKLVIVLKGCAEEKKRCNDMERNVVLLEERAMELETLLRRTVNAKTREATALQQFSIESEDPLLKKFRDMGID